jgi:hypothetical protein
MYSFPTSDTVENAVLMHVELNFVNALSHLKTDVTNRTSKTENKKTLSKKYYLLLASLCYPATQFQEPAHVPTWKNHQSDSPAFIFCFQYFTA